MLNRPRPELRNSFEKVDMIFSGELAGRHHDIRDLA
jgi:hypothetical protein